MGIGKAQAAPAEASAQQTLVAFDIPSQPLDRAILAFAEQSGVQVFFDSRTLAGLRSLGLHDTLNVEEGLRQLLRGMPVRYRFSAPGQVGLERVEESDAIELDSTHVQSKRDGDRVYQAPRSISVITREQIDQRPPRHAADMLEQTAGVYTAVDQRDPGLSVNIRGVQDYGRVNMNIDGMRQNFNVNGHQQRNGVTFVDPEFISSIEIDKGSQSGMGGAGVLGGIASFNTVQASEFLGPGKEVGGRVRAGHGIGEMGNGTYFNGSGVFAFGNEVGDVLVGFSERHFGNYRAGTEDTDNLGTNIRNKDLFPEAWEGWLESEVGDMSSVTRSQMIKLGLNLPEAQRLQLSYMETDTDSKDAWTWMTDDGSAYYYRRSAANDINAKNVALDYSYSPGNDLVDLKAKLYFVTTRQDRWNAASTASLASGNYYAPYNDRFQTDTWGLQVQNTSRFYFGQSNSLAFDYGTELFQDTFKPSSERVPARNENTNPYASGSTPEGKRVMASLFGELKFEHGDWLTLDAGLRYDRYRLTGKTGFTAFMLPTGAPQVDPLRQTTNLLFDVDQEAGRFSPTFGIGVKPGLDWLQLYTRWGRGWRPPSVTEAFMSGKPHGGGNELVYPNPFLKPEQSHNWEAGFNIFKESLFRDGDRFAAKVAYFDTRIENFSFLDTNVDLPGTSGALGTSMGRNAYQNNLETTTFRGVEYSLDYDTGGFYTQLSYTHMIGSNDFCSKQLYMGGAQSRNVVGTELRPVDFGGFIIMLPFDVVQAGGNPALDAAVRCGDIMGNASYMPADRGSLTMGMRFLDQTLDIGARLRYSKGNGENLDSWGYNQLDQAMWPKYKVYDLYASYWMTQNLNIALSVENVTDQAYFVAMGDVNNLSLARGRTLSGMFEYRF
ncbi:TonB-dependent hemoglobin/transferrin/lactoferrin family receptor [Pseudomonas sp. NPDC089554]|uniref:TonB-dependent receptor n=1 Tax=Pseudomonas sp. NPDC089554 TaxID=3390653 RepID=UPI003D058169